MSSVRKPKIRRSRKHSFTIDGYKGFYTSLGYRSARIATSEGRSYMLYPGSAHDERDRKRLIGQSRDFMRDNAIYKGMIERMVNYIVGNGFQLQLRGASDSTISKVEGLWKDWFRKPEIRNLLSGTMVSRMILRELIVAGDVAILKTDKGLIQIFESEQIDGDKPWYPNGIKKDSFGRPVGFQLNPWKNYSIDKKNGRKIDAQDVLFITNPERPSQIRGIPACQSSFAMLHRINDVCDSEAIAWQLLSRLAISIIRQQGPEQTYTESREDPNKTASELEGDLATRLTELDYALIFHGNQGEEVKGIERNIPGMNFTESLRMFLRLLGLPIGLPLELILLDWTQSNYSQSRAVLEQAYENFLFWQQQLEDFFYRPLFEWKLSQWQSQQDNGKSLVGQRNKIVVELIKPTFPWIDQLKEAQACATKVERGFTTHSQICKSLNTDRDEVINRRENEVRDAIKRAKKIEDELGEKVPWQIFAGMKPSQDKAMLAKPEKGE